MYSRWLHTPLSTRIKIAEIFGIEKKGPTEVFNNTIKSDGYLLKDIESLVTPEAIQAFLHTDKTSTEILWNMLVDHVEGRFIPPSVPISSREYPHGVKKDGVPKKCPYFCKEKETHGKTKKT